MKRRTVCGILCTVLALLLGVSGEAYLRNASNRLLAALQLPPDAAETEVFSTAQRAVETWDSVEKLLGAIIKHSDADALGVLFEKLRINAEKREPNAVKACIHACAAQTRVLQAGERLCWENILCVAIKND